MSFQEKLKHEVKSVLLATLFFAGWFVAMVAIKTLVLASYQVEFSGLLKALIGALVVGKVVLVLEHVNLSNWVRRQPAWLDLMFRTLLYVAGVFLVLLGEKMFHERHEHEGFGALLAGAFETANAHEVLAKTICVGWALLTFNALTVVRRRLGTPALLGLFTSPLPPESKSPG